MKTFLKENKKLQSPIQSIFRPFGYVAGSRISGSVIRRPYWCKYARF